MNPLFHFLVVTAFLVQVFNYRELGKDRVNHYTWLYVLGCFVVTEGMIAMEKPVYWLYVVLNIWGIYNLFTGKADEDRC